MATAMKTEEQLDRIQQQIEALTSKAQGLMAAAKSKGIVAAKMLISQHGITAEDLGLVATGVVKSPAKNAAAKKAGGRARGPKPAKYRNPATGETWSGMGKAPSWIATARKPRESFLIASQEGNAVEPAAKVPAGKKVPKSGQASKKAVKKAASASKPAVKKTVKVAGAKLPARKSIPLKKAAKKTAAEPTGQVAAKQDAAAASA